MKYAVNIPNFGNNSNPEHVRELAQLTEDSGWDGFFIWDHLLGYGDNPIPVFDPWILLSIVAEHTNTLKLGTMITPVARRRPWKLVRELLTLDHLSQGRTIFGVGLGSPPEEFSIFSETSDNKVRAKKLDEGLDIILGLTSGQPFEYKGEYFQIDEITFLPTPFNSKIPIWVGGMWPIKAPFRRAARYDGVAPISIDAFKMLTDAEVKDIIDFIRNERGSISDYDICIHGDTQNGENHENLKKLGVTWWSENINGMRGDYQTILGIIENGPPR